MQKIPGSHVIIETGGQTPPDRTVTEAMQLAAYYSQAREGQNVPVDYTPVKYVKKPAGARPGMVIYTTYQTGRRHAGRGAVRGAEGEELMEERHYAFFQNTDCEYFPCHKTAHPESFNCLFCYCPLYALGRECGGNFCYTESGIKNCVNCMFPHRKENYDRVIARFGDIVRKMQESEKEHE